MQIATGAILLVSLGADLTYVNQDIVHGFLLRVILANGISFAFLFLYFSIFGGIYSRSYRTKREVWLGGRSLFLLAMGTVSLGYMLP